MGTTSPFLQYSMNFFCLKTASIFERGLRYGSISLTAQWNSGLESYLHLFEGLKVHFAFGWVGGALQALHYQYETETGRSFRRSPKLIQCFRTYLGGLWCFSTCS